MTSIVKANFEDFRTLTDIGKASFLESHGHSASEEDISNYVSEKYNHDVFKSELNDSRNIYHIIYHNGQPAGYSKIIYNASHPNVPMTDATKLERIYLLKEFYNLKLGAKLLQFNIELSKQNDQAGMWLFVWKENPRAVNFYKKKGFVIIGSHDFKISETHSNPNHQMLLKY
ncbi:MAG: GNAT family N-acetyltransferase [Bacteroidota bacterium]